MAEGDGGEALWGEFHKDYISITFPHFFFLYFDISVIMYFFVPLDDVAFNRTALPEM